MIVYLIKQGDTMLPDPDVAGNVEEYEKIPNGKPIKCETKLVRNYKNLCRYQLMVTGLYKYQDNFSQRKHFVDALKIMAGYYDDLGIVNGNHMMSPKSISYESCEELDFKQVFEDCIHAVYNNPEYFGVTDQNRPAVFNMLMKF